MKYGLYCGTFNPFHNGHLDIYNKACKIFDKVIVAQGVNPEKKLKAWWKSTIPLEISSTSYSGLTTDLVKLWRQAKGATSVTLIRGLRNGYDYDYEMNQIAVMRDLLPDLDVVLIPCEKQFSHISSSMIRALDVFDEKAAEQYLPIKKD